MPPPVWHISTCSSESRMYQYGYMPFEIDMAENLRIFWESCFGRTGIQFQLYESEYLYFQIN
jgi:hypothetical protein